MISIIGLYILGSVTSPMEGDIWSVNNTYTIEWNSQSTVHVQLEMYDGDIPFNKCPQCEGEIVHIDEAEGKKDACYHKVKSRYKVWPSAYASGALVQCRKKGAKNWGNKSKKKK